MRAVFGLPCDKWIDATTDAPTAEHKSDAGIYKKQRRNDIHRRQSIAAKPRPTNMPSVITKRADDTMPSNVGMSSLLKRLDTFVVPKSILSFIILYGYLLLISGRKSKCLKTKGS